MGNPVGNPMGNPVGIPMGIPTEILWEWELKFHSHANPARWALKYLGWHMPSLNTPSCAYAWHHVPGVGKLYIL